MTIEIKDCYVETSWQQRAEAAEAKLAELAKQKPVCFIHPRMLDYVLDGSRTCGRVWGNSVDEISNEDRFPLFTRPAPAVSLAELVPTVCDGKEQEAFEAYAQSKGLDLTIHPLHYLFLDGKTNQARSAWRECLVYVSSAILRNIEEAK